MSLPTFKLTPTTNSANSSLSPKAKMEQAKSGVIPDIISNAKSTASSLEFPSMKSLSSSVDTASSSMSSLFSSTSSSLSSLTSSDSNGDSGTDFFSFSFLIRLILFVAIGWFMWVNLAENGDFHLGMTHLTEKISGFFHDMEENGRTLYSRITGHDISVSSPPSNTDTTNEENSSDTNNNDNNTNDNTGKQIVQRRDFKAPPQTSSQSMNHNIPFPPPMTNSSDKKPGFSQDDPKYKFLDKAVRDYSGPSPSPDDSTSKTQKHQSGKAGYCYIGEDRGFRGCVKVEAGDNCMSGDVYSRQDICMDPTLRE